MPATESGETAVSTILENLFQELDEDLVAKNPQYEQLEKRLKLRSALTVFFAWRFAEHSGAAKSLIILPVSRPPPSAPDKISPMVIPTRQVLYALGTSRLTTLVEPLYLPWHIEGTLSEHEEYHDYAVDLERNLNDGFEHFLRMRAYLRVTELGWAKHGRKPDGRLCWTLTQSGRENVKNGRMEELLLADICGEN